MSSGGTERALRSFLADDEQLLDTWTVEGITRGLSLSVPQLGGAETLALSDRRLLWLDDELETVELDEIDDLEHTSMDASGGGLIALAGGLALLLGLVATPLLWLFTSLPTPQALAPLGLGLLAFLAGVVASQVREGDPDSAADHHYLQVRTDETVVQVFADAELVDAIGDRIERATD